MPRTRSAGPRAPAQRASRLNIRDLATWALAIGAALVLATTLLVAVGPRFLPFQTYTVLSGSMRPAIPVGALVVARPVRPQDLREGDMITFTRPGDRGALVTHRIIRIHEGPSGPVFETKGDANGAPDDWEVPGTGTGWRHAFHVPYLGYAFSGIPWPGVRLGVQILLVIGLAVWALMWIWTPARRLEEVEEQAS